MLNKNNLAAAALILLATQSAEAATIAYGSVDWQFTEDAIHETLPPITGLTILEGRFGGPYQQSTGLFDDTGTASTSLGQSMGSVQYDAVTGSYAFDVAASAPAPDVFTSISSGSLPNRYLITTDILTFSYDYSFFGTKNDPLDSLAFNVQVEVLSNDDIFYSDYRPEHETYGTNRALFASYGNTGVSSFDEHGTRWFQFGEAGVFRNWVVRTDMNFGASDDRAPVTVPEPSSLLMFGAGLLGVAIASRVKRRA